MEETKQEVRMEENEMLVKESAESGDIQISQSVLNTIVKKYTLDIDGVIRFQSQSLMDGMLDILGKRSSDRSVIIEQNEDKAAIITLTLVMRFGVVIPDVAQKLQNTIKSKVEELTGYKVARVNVNVCDLELPPPPPEKVEEEAEAKEPSDEENSSDAPAEINA
ncbi:MAG: Asp23/Gls24 family envelope stress response protein [Victivallales bacterium]|nr:Asp23/Gls24 family envelope stress response protein [Victivallales bacterium]